MAVIRVFVFLVLSFAFTCGSSNDGECGDTLSSNMVCCKWSISEIKMVKEDPSHDACCCNENGEKCTSYAHNEHVCVSGVLKPLNDESEVPCMGSPLSSHKTVCCKNPIEDFSIAKSRPFHDACCCNENGENCSSYARNKHICDKPSGRLLALNSPAAKCTRHFSTRQSSRYSCCGDDSVYLPAIMSCDHSSGEVTLKAGSMFQSHRLCRKKLHPGFDDGPAPILINKELYIEGRVEKVRVDIGANYVIIDLLPVRLNSTYGIPTCGGLSQGRLRVMVRLPPRQWCKPLDEVHQYLDGKTLDIWTDLKSLRYCRSKLPALVIPSESSSDWMMVSRRPFYLKL